MLELSAICDPSCKGACPGTTDSPHLCRHVCLPCTDCISHRCSHCVCLRVGCLGTATRQGVQLQGCSTDARSLCLLQEVP